MVLILSALSGCVWGVIGAYLLTDGRMDARSWGGLLASPLIGIAAGMAATRFRDLTMISRLLVPLASLYATALLFAFAAGVWSTALGVVQPGQGGAPLNLFGLVVRSVYLAFVGLTVSGYGLILWPLAVMNHLLIWRWPPRRSTSPRGPLGLQAV